MWLRFFALALLFIPAACQSVAMRSNTLPQKYLGEWRDFSAPTHGYRFYPDGRCETLYAKNERPKWQCQYKALFAGDVDTYYILIRETHTDEMEKSYYDYQALQLYYEPIIDGIALRITSNYNDPPLLNDEGWNNASVAEHAQYIKDQNYVIKSFSRSLSFSFFYKLN